MKASRRVNVLHNHFAVGGGQRQVLGNQTSSSLGRVGRKSPDDIVIVTCVRTAIGKAKRGSFKNTAPDNMLSPLLKYIVENHKGLNPTDIGDIVIGTVLPRGGQGATEVRIASLLAGIPKEVPCTIVNRQCSSGLQAIANVAASIRSGYYDFAIAGGVESMSLNGMGWDGAMNNKAMENKLAMGCYMGMGQTSEEVAARYNISRKTQDTLAVVSHQRAIDAIKSGRFKDEIVPITVEVEDRKTGETKTVTVSQDEGIRPGTTLEKLGRLRAVFKQGGSTTAGNASQLSDGASVALVTSRGYAEKKGWPILGVMRSFAAVGVEPAIMGVGPAKAIPAALKTAGLSVDDIDLYEINEAFASQATYCVNKLGISMDKVNVNGGAIALGHPLGMTGTRMTATLLHELKRRQGRYGVVSMCIGSGMGAAAVYEREN